jgi:general stress protein 26
MSDDIKKQFWKALADSPYVMVGKTGGGEHHIPMNAQLDKDADSAFWFFTSTDNRLANGGPAMAQFASKGHDLFACISGTLVRESDRAVLDKLWSNGVAAWYDGGRTIRTWSCCALTWAMPKSGPPTSGSRACSS